MGDNIIEFDNNDVYFMENLEDFFIINDNYIGIIILDKNLEIIRKLELLNDLIIYCSFKYKNEILLYCDENNCFIYVNAESFQYKIIPLKEFESVMFSIVYQWDEKNIILSDYKGFFVTVDIQNGILKEVDSQNRNIQTLKKSYTALRKFVPVKVNLSENKTLVKTADSRLVMIQKEKEEPLAFFDEELYHDYEFSGDYFAKIGERKVEILAKDTNVSFMALKDDFFLRGKFFAEKNVMYFFLLSSRKDDASKSKIERYTFDLRHKSGMEN